MGHTEKRLLLKMCIKFHRKEKLSAKTKQEADKHKVCAEPSLR